jgi:hypothetical protein
MPSRPKSLRLLLEYPGELAGLLGDPGARRVGGAAGEMNAPTRELDEEEDVQALERDRFDCEEVDREDAVGLLPKECPPRQPAPAIGWANARLAEDLAHCCRRDPQAESVDLSDDPRIAPAWVLAGKAKNEFADFVSNRWPATPSRVAPAASNEPPVPPQERGRRHRKRAPARSR